MEFCIPIPQKLEESSFVMEQWLSMMKAFKTRSSVQQNQSDKNIPASLLSCVLGDDLDKFTSSVNGLAPNITELCSKIFEMLELSCIPKILLMYERHIYFSLKQLGSETADAFINRLHHQADVCDFGVMRDGLLFQCVLTGLNDGEVKPKFDNLCSLDMARAISVCSSSTQHSKKSFSERVSEAFRELLSSQVTIKRETEESMFDSETYIHCSTESDTSQDCESGSYSSVESTEPQQGVGESGTRQKENEAAADDVETRSGLVAEMDQTINKKAMVSSTKESHIDHSDTNGSVTGQMEANVLRAETGQPAQENSPPMMTLRVRRKSLGDSTLSSPENPEKRMRSSERKAEQNSHALKEDKNEKQQSTDTQRTQTQVLRIRREGGGRHHSTLFPKREAYQFSVLNKSCSDTVSKGQNIPAHEAKLPFQCDKCTATFSTRKGLFIHISKHGKKNRFRRNVNPGLKGQNGGVSEDELPFQCEECRAKFSTRKGLFIHISSHVRKRRSDGDATLRLNGQIGEVSESEPSLQCDECSATFSTRKGLFIHISKHGKKNRFRSNVNPGLKGQNSGFSEDELPFQCEECRAKFSTRKGLFIHISSHVRKRRSDGDATLRLNGQNGEVSESEPSLQCDECSATFSTRKGLCIHVSKHMKKNRFKGNAAGSREGKLYEGPEGERRFQCDVCNATFHTKKGLFIHAGMHLKKRRFGKQRLFQKKSHARGRPMLMKSKVKKCELCHKTFPSNCALQVHQRKHTGERPYHCETCGKSFAYVTSMIVHSRRHTGEKPYACSICSYQSRQLSNLQSHMKIHSQELPLKCGICGCMFRFKSHLASHMEILHYVNNTSLK